MHSIWSVISLSSKLTRLSSSLRLCCHVSFERVHLDGVCRIRWNDTSNAIGCIYRGPLSHQSPVSLRECERMHAKNFRSICRRALVIRKRALCLKQEPSISIQQPRSVAKESCIFTRGPGISTHPQKSPCNPQKSRISQATARYLHKRTLLDGKRALYLYNRALHLDERSLYILKRALIIRKRDLHVKQEPSISTKEPQYVANRPSISTKEP